MNRKGSDLLDVFRSAPRKSSGEGPRSGGGGGGGGSGRTWTLGRRHLLVVGAGATLVVVLAFVAGIGIGRGKGRASGVPLAGAAAARTWRLPGAALPRIGTNAQQVVPLVKASLERDWPQLIGHYTVQDVASAPPKAARFRIVVFGIRDRDEAERWQALLTAWYVGGHFPFEHTRPEPE